MALTFEPRQSEPLVIRINRGGAVEEHTFEVLPMVRSRYEAALRAQREAQNAETIEAAPILAALCDELVRSTNGPQTITSLWKDELLPLEMLARISTALIKEAAGGDPPA